MVAMNDLSFLHVWIMIYCQSFLPHLVSWSRVVFSKSHKGHLELCTQNTFTFIKGTIINFLNLYPLNFEQKYTPIVATCFQQAYVGHTRDINCFIFMISVNRKQFYMFYSVNKKQFQELILMLFCVK